MSVTVLYLPSQLRAEAAAAACLYHVTLSSGKIRSMNVVVVWGGALCCASEPLITHYLYINVTIAQPKLTRVCINNTGG
jgi:hypothetical protein